MKKIFRLLATILICAFVLSSVNLSALNQTIRDEFNAQAELIESLRSYSSDYYRNTLTDEKEVELYDRVLTAMLYRKSECSFYFTDSAELNKIAIYVCLDNPFLTITNQYYESENGYGNQNVIEQTLNISYLPFSFPDANYYEKMTEVVDEANKIILGMPQFDNEYDKAKYLHDYIVGSVRYTYDYSDTDADTAYGALINHTARCEGYTDAYAILLKLAGIDSAKVIYFGSDINESAGHIWNMISLDGNWYHVDTTNDSFGNDETIPQDYASYAFFLISTEDILKSYPINSLIQSLVPACDNDTDNFFVRNGLYFDSYDRYDVGKAAGLFLHSQLIDGLNGVSVKFSNESAYNKALADNEIPYLLYIISDYDGANTRYYNYFYNDQQLVITFFAN